MAEDINLRVTATDDASQTLEQVKAKGDEIDAQKVSVDVTATDGASAVLDADAEKAAALDAENPVVNVTANDQAAPVLEADQALVEELSGTPVVIDAEVTGNAPEELQAVATAEQNVVAASAAATGALTGVASAEAAAGTAGVAAAAGVDSLAGAEKNAATVSSGLQSQVQRLSDALVALGFDANAAGSIFGEAYVSAIDAGASVTEAEAVATEAAISSMSGYMQTMAAMSTVLGMNTASMAAHTAAVEEDAIAMEELDGGVSVGVRDISRMGAIAAAAGVSFGGLSNRVITSAIALTAFSGLGAEFAIPIIGGLVGLGALMQSFSGGVSEATQVTKELTQALREQKGTIDQINIKKVTDDYKDYGDAMRYAGITNEELNAALLGSAPALNDVIQRLNQAKLAHAGNSDAMGKLQDLTTKITQSNDAYRDSNQKTFRTELDRVSATGALSEAQRDLFGRLADSKDSQERLRIAQQLGLTTTNSLTGTTIDWAKAINLVDSSLQTGGESADDYKKRTEEVAKAQEAAKKSALDEAKAIAGVTDAMLAASDDTFAYNKAARDAAQAQDDLSGKIKQVKDDLAKGKIDQATAQREIQQAYDDTAQAATQAAAAQVKMNEDQVKAAGGIVTATQHIDNLNASLLTSVASTKGPVRDALIGYIAQLNGIPSDKATEILANTDDKNLAEKKAAIDAISQNRALSIKVDADTSYATQQVNSWMRENADQTITIHTEVVNPDGTISTSTRRMKMAGGPVNESGIYDVGEAGRERVFLPRGANVMTAGQVMTADAGAAMAVPIVINVNAKVDPTVNLAQAGRKIAEALEAFYRTSGSRRAYAPTPVRAA